MKKTLLTLLLSILTITAVTGCGDKTDTSQIESSSEQSTDSSDISEVTDDNSESESAAVTGTFDWDTAMSQTTLEGREVPMPFSVNDLGETYELSGLVNAFFGGSGCTASLLNTAYEDSETGEVAEKRLGSVSFDYVSAEEYTDDCKISYFESDELNIQGIQEGVSMELVYDTWGEPHESDDVAVYYFNKEQDKVISIYIDDENKILCMNVDFMFDKDETDDTTETDSVDSTESGTFDWDTAMSQTTLVGKEVPMPFSVNDLGSNYRLGAISNDIFDGDGCGAHLYNTAYVHPETGRTIEKNLGYVSFNNVNAEEYTDDCKIGYVARMDDLCVQGIQEGVPMEQVYAAWGEPNEVINGVSYYYGDVDCSKAIIVYSDEENCVDQMNVDFEKDEN